MFVKHAWKVRGMKFQENPSNGSRCTEEKILDSPNNVPLTIYRSQPHL